MKNHIITSLDIGTHTIKSLAISQRLDGEGFEVLSQVNVSSFGVRRGVVAKVEKVAELIHSLLEQTEKECGKPIKEVYININGGHLFSTVSRGTIAVSRADQKISQEDVDRVIQAAQTFSMPSNKEILDVFPKEFTVDGVKEIKQVIGMEGVRLEAEILALACFSPYLKNLEKAVIEAGYGILDILASPLASAQAVLSLREKELGVLVLDIGAGTTGLAVFLEESLIHFGVIPIGSGHITTDIAIGLQTDIETAERIKLQFGSCFLTGSKKIKIKEKDSQETLVFSQKALGRIIDARMAEIFEQVKKELKKANLPKLPAGVVLCGGGVKLPKIKDWVKNDLKLPVKIGRPKGFFPAQDDPQLACVCGLALLGKEVFQQKKSFVKGIFQKAKEILKSFIP